MLIFSTMGIIALKAPGRDYTNNNELLHKIGALQRYAMQLFVFTREVLQAIRWRSKYNGCTQNNLITMLRVRDPVNPYFILLLLTQRCWKFL